MLLNIFREVIHLSHVSDESSGTKPLSKPHKPELESHQYTLIIQKIGNVVNKLKLCITFVTGLVTGSPLEPLIMTSQHSGLQGPRIYTAYGWCKNNLATLERFV